MIVVPAFALQENTNESVVCCGNISDSEKKIRVSLNRYDVSLVHIRCGRLAQTIYRLIGLAQFRAVCQGY